MDEAKNLRRSSLIILGGTVIGQAIGYVYAVAAARVAGPLAYGQFALVFSLITVGTALATLGLNRSIVRFVGMYTAARKFDHLKGTVLMLGVFLMFTSISISLIIALLAPALASRYLNDSSLVDAVRLGALLVPLIVLTHFMLDVLRGLRMAEYRTYIESFVQKPVRMALISTISATSTALVQLTVIELVATATGALAAVGVFWRKLKPLITDIRKVTPTKDILRFSLPMVPASLLTAFGNQTETLVLGWLGYTIEAGMLNAALRTASFGSIILFAFNSNFAPLISGLCDTGEIASLGLLFRKITYWQMMIMVGWCGLTIVLSQDLLWLFGEDFAGGARFALALLCLRQVTDTILGPVGLMITMGGWGMLTFVNTALYLGLSIVLDILLIPRWGTTGAALSVLLTSILLNGFVSVQVWRFYKTHALSARSIWLTVLGLGAVPLVMLVRSMFLYDNPWWLQMSIVAAFYAIIYCGIIVLLLTNSEREWLSISIQRVARGRMPRFLRRGP